MPRPSPATAEADAAAPPRPAAAPAPITMPQGLPGFPGMTRYALGPLPSAERFLRLQAEDPNGPSFVVLPADEAGAGALLDPAALAEARDAAGLDGAGEVAVLFVITSTREADGRLRLFANRRAPILVDTRRQTAFQVVLARPDYPVREPLLAAA